jgi:hypothetical protein
MVAADDDEPLTHDELIRARDDLQRHLRRIRNPFLGFGRSRPLEAKLTAMIKDIDDCLAAMESDNA